MRSVTLLAVLVLAPVAFASKSASAQAHSLVGGQEVRIAHRCGIAHAHVVGCRAGLTQRVDTGHVAVIDADTIRLQVQWSDVVLALPTNAVSAMWVRERQGHTWRGAGVGLVAGTLLGAVIGSRLEWCLNIMGCEPMPATGLGAIIGAPVGFLVGGVVGYAIRSSHWEEVPLDRLRVGVVPKQDGRVGFGLSVAF